MPTQRTSIEDRLIVGRTLSQIMDTDLNVMQIDGIEIPVDDIYGDYLRFRQQEEFYMKNGLLWPSVVLDRVDLNDNTYSARFAPIDAPSLIETSPAEAQFASQETIEDARSQGLPVSTLSVEQARFGFRQGVIDTIFGRARSRQFFSGDPFVTVETPPDTGVRIKYTKGYFFSTANVFGNTEHSEHLRAGTYCFYRSTRKPTYAMDLYTITRDRTITNP
jgi:hypothetical protein